MTHICVTLRMKGNGRIRLIFVERYGRGCHIEGFYIKTGFALDAFENGCLHFFFAFHAISTACKKDGGKQ